jgi:hypothetical protein
VQERVVELDDLGVGCGSRWRPCSTYARQIGAVPSGRSVSDRSERSVKVYISF